MASTIEQGIATALPEHESASNTGADFSLSEAKVWQKKPSTKDRGELFHRGLEPTPVDPVTGLAYPIMPHKGQLTPDNSSDHHAAHKRLRRELSEVENGVVIRTSRMQKVYGPGGSLLIGNKLMPHHTPHQRYHYFFSGPEKLPEDSHEQFKYGVWAGSIYVPEFGLDVRGDKPRLARMYPDQVERLMDRQLYVGAIDTLRLFLRQYVMDNGIPQIDSQDIDRFMNTEDLEQRIEFGRIILDAASRIVSEPMETDFARARKRGRVKPMLGKCVAEVVQMNVTFGNQKKLVNQLHTALAA